MLKTVRLGLAGRKFDDQYTFDLQGYLSVHDFCSTVQLFNEVVRRHPPPGHKAIWTATLITTWILTGTLVYILWTFLPAAQLYLVAILPTIMILTTPIWVWRYRSLRRKASFESSLVELCSRINATENIRGINYRLVSNKQRNDDVMIIDDQHGMTPSAAYALLIEFDDRYRALFKSQPPSDNFALYPYSIPHQPAPAHVHPRMHESPLMEKAQPIPPSSSVFEQIDLYEKQ
ncbi:hypothetical protein BCR43DRAFT_524739 [Syncephalastrum racemosum]|uniref:Uncharacterized protein n=1 Tax=Syncephalastrum racemosum TaxID=13706 RepID=A0A1X2HD01_SYNRA|nr:hypothetical protein BCR43DRAFT_524739 [Syncephalastrum racemosum]